MPPSVTLGNAFNNLNLKRILTERSAQYSEGSGPCQGKNGSEEMQRAGLCRLTSAGPPPLKWEAPGPAQNLLAPVPNSIGQVMHLELQSVTFFCHPTFRGSASISVHMLWFFVE